MFSPQIKKYELRDVMQVLANANHSPIYKCIKSTVYTMLHVNRLSQLPGGSDACHAGDLGLTAGSEDPLEKGMATHSSILAWRIPRTEQPGELQSMESQSQTQLSNYHISVSQKQATT